MQISKEEEEEAEGDDEDFDDNASVVTASTAISGDRAGGALVVAGAGEHKTMFGVDAEGTGTGDAAEVVHFVSSSERGARVRSGRVGRGGREGGPWCSVAVAC